MFWYLNGMMWNRHFEKLLSALRVAAETPAEVSTMSIKEKKVFAKIFQMFDRLFAQLKSFTQYDENMLETYGITEEEYDRLCRALSECDRKRLKNIDGNDPEKNPPTDSGSGL